MDVATLSAVMGGSASMSRYSELLPGYENAMRAAKINTPRRAAMWAAQLGHESVGLKYMEEIASGSAYNGRVDLGNIQPGDGPRFKGRGPIQLTGRAHYRNFTQWARREGHSTLDFEANPTLLAQPHWGFLAATYYWTVSRPRLNEYSDAGDLFSASADINGWIRLANGKWRTPNGYADRQARYNRAMGMAERLLPGEVKPSMEKVLEYSRDQIRQDTVYNCGPASVQTVVQSATKKWIGESQLGRELGTHTGGTDYIGSFPAVLNRHVPGGKYIFRNLPGYQNAAGKNTVWNHIVGSINAGHGVVVNIVAPPSNYPRAVAPSTISPAYRGGTVYHYIAVMGYSDGGGRRVWVADSGFSPFGYWLGFDQLCSLIVPKGYAYSTAESKKPAPETATPVAPKEESPVAGIIGKVVSLINPSKQFDPDFALSLIDRAAWENNRLLKSLLLKLGEDPDQIIADAIAEDLGKDK